MFTKQNNNKQIHRPKQNEMLQINQSYFISNYVNINLHAIFFIIPVSS